LTTFTATESSAEGRLMFWMAPYAEDGVVYSFDDVVLEELPPIVISPSIIEQPQSLTITAYQSATFSVVATGTEPLTYQWLINGVIAYDSVYPYWTIPDVGSGYNGSVIECVVYNLNGSVKSTPATLTVVTEQTDYERGFSDGYASAKAVYDAQWQKASKTVNDCLDTVTIEAGVQFSMIRKTMA
jgi:hypothetical protein